jgi:hypothetical protein
MGASGSKKLQKPDPETEDNASAPIGSAGQGFFDIMYSNRTPDPKSE